MEGNICVEIISIIVSAILSIVSIGIAINASCQTKKQIELSNKHKLFDRRLEKYTLFLKLLENYDKQKEHLINRDYLLDPLILLSNLMNAHYYDGLIEYASDGTPSIKYERFNSKYESLILKAKEIDILWQSDDGKIVGRFVELYAKVVYCLYLQSGYMYNLLALNNLNIRERSKISNELENCAQESGLVKAIEDLGKIYSYIVENKIDEKLKSTIKLED